VNFYNFLHFLQFFANFDDFCHFFKKLTFFAIFCYFSHFLRIFSIFYDFFQFFHKNRKKMPFFAFKLPFWGQKLGPFYKLFRFFDHFSIRTRSPQPARHIGIFCNFDPEIFPICRRGWAEGVKNRSKNRFQTPF